MSFDRKRVLCFGSDETLVNTRRLLLESVGYAASATTSLSIAEQRLMERDIAVLILCHTVKAMEVERLSRLNHAMRGCTLVLTLKHRGGDSLPNCSAVFDAHDQPQEFLAAVNRLSAAHEQQRRQDASHATTHAVVRPA